MPIGAIKSLLCIPFLAISLAASSFAASSSSALPPGFKATDYLTGLNQCITLGFAPDGRLFFLEKSGRVRVVENGRLLAEPWAEIAVDQASERGLLGIAFDPDFKTNRFAYLYYSVKHGTDNRVVRMRDANGRGVEPVTVLDIKDHIKEANHNGGNLTFGPDGFLYITVGDGGGWPGRSQDDGNLLGKILRVDVRGALPVTYKKPSDIFYAKGLRNSFDMAWNPANGVLYATENGPIGRDEINMIVRGGDYGWPTETGRNKSNRFKNPIWDFGIRSVAPTGITFYPKDGNFPAEYRGNMFVTDYNYGRVYRIKLPGERLDAIRAEDMTIFMPERFADAVFADVTVGPDGALYLAGFFKIVRISYEGK